MKQQKLYKAPKWLLKFLGKEDRLTIQCANILRSYQICFTHTFNEGKRTNTQQQKLTGFGVMSGLPDFLVFEPKGRFVGLALELKVKYDKGGKNRLSDSQKEAQEVLRKKGWKVTTVWDVDEFLKELKRYFSNA